MLRLEVKYLVPNYMLSWQQGAIVAACVGIIGVWLGRVGSLEGPLGRQVASHLGPFLREAGVVFGLYALWQLADSLHVGTAGAIGHSWQVWHAERTLRLPSELAVQHLLLPHPLLSQAANVYYATMHFGLLIAMLVWLFSWHRDRYPAVRNAMAAVTAICLVISFVPVAPPRMLTSLGFVDLAARYGQSVYAAMGAPGLDQLSAMPSVHVAWAVLVAWAVITSGASRWRWLILVHPVLTVFVVVATGNHFWADGIVATLIVVVVLVVQAAITAFYRRARRADL